TGVCASLPAATASRPTTHVTTRAKRFISTPPSTDWACALRRSESPTENRVAERAGTYRTRGEGKSIPSFARSFSLELPIVVDRLVFWLGPHERWGSALRSRPRSSSARHRFGTR